MVMIIWNFRDHNLFAGRGSWSFLMAAGWWGWRMLKAELQFGNFLKPDNNEVCCIGWLFLSEIISLWHVILFDSNLLIVEYVFTLQNWCQSAQILIYQLSLWSILNMLVVISIIFMASSPGVKMSISRDHFLCSSTGSNFLSIEVCHQEIAEIQLHLQAPLQILFSCYFHHVWVTSFTEVLSASKSSVRV